MTNNVFLSVGKTSTCQQEEFVAAFEQYSKVNGLTRVITTGHGRTKNWGNTVGTVTKRRGDKVFLLWEEISLQFHLIKR